MDLTITHTAAEGTLLAGDPRPHHQLVKNAGFRYSRNIGWYIQGSRDRAPRRYAIDQVVASFAAIGVTVTVDIDTTARPTAEREADRAERLADRADALDYKADRKATEADVAFGRAKAIGDMIPFGQPILVGHHSERRHRKDIGRIDRATGAGVEAYRDSVEAARRADASRANLAHHQSGPATVRRIERLETELRDIQRKLTPCPTSGRKMKPEAEGRTIGCPRCYNEFTVADGQMPVHGGATGEWADRLNKRAAEITEEVDYWRNHITDIGFVMATPDQFKKGDRVRMKHGTGTVIRVNPKSLTVSPDSTPSFRLKYGYEEVTLIEKEA